MRRLSGLILGGLMLIVFCLSLGLVNADWTINQAKGYMNTTDRIAIGYFEPAPNATLDVANWSRMQGIRVHTLIVDGNVGIGTTEPGALFDLRGLLQFNPFIGEVGETRADLNLITQDNTKNAWFTLFRTTNTTGEKSFVMFKGDGTATVVNKLSVNGDSYITGGNVGIGTTRPYAKLHIRQEGDALQNEWWTGHPIQIWGNDQDMQIGVDTSRRVAYIQSVDHGTAVSNLALNPRGGNVGIGTTSPQATLHLHNSSGNAILKITNKKNYGVRIGPWVEANAINFDPLNNSAEFYFGRDNTLSKFVIMSGNVSIGTTSPGKKFEVVGDILSRKSSGIDKAIALTADDKGGNIWVNNAYNSSNPTSGWTRAITINSTNGNVGIGTTNPTFKLEVNGKLGADGFGKSDCQLIDSDTSGGDLWCPEGYYVAGAKNHPDLNWALDKIWCCKPK